MNLTQTVKTAVLAIAIAAGTVGAQRAVAQQPQADSSGDWGGRRESHNSFEIGFAWRKGGDYVHDGDTTGVVDPEALPPGTGTSVRAGGHRGHA